jgi:hypothetical protein
MVPWGMTLVVSIEPEMDQAAPSQRAIYLLESFCHFFGHLSHFGQIFFLDRKDKAGKDGV